MPVMLTHWSTFTQKEIEMEPQTLWAAISIFVSFLFTVATIAWAIRKAIGDVQVEMAKSQAETNKAIGELRADTAKSFGEMKGEMKGLKGQVGYLGEEVRGINEFLRRDSVKDSEKNKES